MESFSAHSRSETLKKSETRPLDVIVIGGGITGAGILLDAARHGLNTLLLEKSDFASATSSVSSKLVHGGLRYLETFNIGLVFESVRERKRLLELAPSLVKPLPFMVPIYRGQRRGLWTVYIGTWIYYLLALFRNIGRPHRYGKQATLQKEMNLKSDDLTGSVEYFDASTIDSRLTLSAIKTAWELGAKACNHAEVKEYMMEGNRVTGVVVEDQMTRITYRIHAKWVVNAVGPWTDLIRKNPVPNAQKTIRLTKGAHILFPGNPFNVQRAILMLSPVDGRVVFVIPWCGNTLVGTTDDDYKGDPEKVRVEKEDIDYLIQTALYYFPSIRVSPQQIMTTFVGLRCLKEEAKDHPSDVSREHLLFSEQPGLVTIAGGKLTTFLSMGEDAVNWLIDHEPHWGKMLKTDLVRLADVTPIEAYRQSPQGIFESLIENEMAVTVRDLLQYRTLAYFFTPDHGKSLIDVATKALQSKLGYSDEEMKEQIQEYRDEIAKQI